MQYGYIDLNEQDSWDMSKKISFDVMVLTKGRWVIHATYSEKERAHAVRDAKSLENLSTTTSVKVVREETNSDTGKTQEDNIYASSNLPDDQPKIKKEEKKEKPAPKVVAPAKKTKPKPVKKSHSMVPGKDIPEEIEAFDPDDNKKKKLSLFGVFIRILIIILVSVLISGLVAASAFALLNGSSLGVKFQTNIYIGLFIITFAVSFIAMTSSLLSEAQFLTPKPPKPPEPEPERKFKSKLKPIKTQKSELQFNDDAGKKKETDGNEEEDEDDIASEIGADIPSANDALIEEHGKFIMKYLADSMADAGVDKDKLDNYNRFGINLFIAGACETLAQHKNLDSATIAKIMGEPIKFMGFKAKDAEAFPAKVQGYLLSDSKYMQMYQAGRSALEHSFSGNVDRPVTLKLALEDWNKPKEKVDEPNAPITVMFTDIAGSTNMTQTLGDSVAQQVVRTHNRIVRDALKRFGGKEVKHTGDGIMASFSITSNGVEATAKMQIDTLKHNTENPDLPLGLKIGLNTGEAIAEDNDLFGTTVQLAARIVDKAQSGQIFVSETVHGICGGKTYEFISRGTFDLKGFGGDPTLYELVWNKDAVPEPEPAEAAEPEEEKVETASDPVETNEGEGGDDNVEIGSALEESKPSEMVATAENDVDMAKDGSSTLVEPSVPEAGPAPDVAEEPAEQELNPAQSDAPVEAPVETPVINATPTASPAVKEEPPQTQ
jgi:adenylate cyclase